MAGATRLKHGLAANTAPTAALGDPVLEGVRYNRAQINVTPWALGELLHNRMSD